MTKRDFVRQYVLDRFDPSRPAIDRLIREGERLWQRLSENGYGAAKEQGPREHMDWYTRLTDEQRAYFDRFWAAFDLKRGKQRAAMRWGQICPDADLAEHIIESAAAEAERKLPDGQARKMAEGWLAERRFEDFQPTRQQTEQSSSQERALETRRLKGEIAHLDRLLQHERQAETAQQLREQADELRGRLAALEQEAASG